MLQLHVNPARIIGDRNPMLYGHFLEHFHRQVYDGVLHVVEFEGFLFHVLIPIVVGEDQGFQAVAFPVCQDGGRVLGGVPGTKGKTGVDVHIVVDDKAHDVVPPFHLVATIVADFTRGFKGFCPFFLGMAVVE